MTALTWVSLMGRHAASATVYASGLLRYLDDRATEPTGGQFFFWHGPGERWRIEDADHQIVYTQDADNVAYTRGDDGTVSHTGDDIRVPLTYASFRPFDVVGPNSLLYRMTTSMRVLGPPAQVDHDGRPAWKTALQAYETTVEATIDDATGFLVKMAADGVVPVEVVDLVEHEELPESTFKPELSAGPARVVPLPTAAEIVEAAQPRLEILDAIATGLERRDDLFRIVSTAQTPEYARVTLKEEFGLSDTGADAILAMQLSRLTVAERAKVSAERDETRQTVNDNLP